MRPSGCLCAIPTPFLDDRVDTKALAAHATWLVDHGVRGVVVCGTTGESVTLDAEEQVLAVQTVVGAVGSRALVVAGAGTNSTAASIGTVQRMAAETEARAVMCVVPYYNKPTQAGIVAHFHAIADRSPLPVIAYNVPARTGISMTVESMVKVGQHANVIGIKEASADLFQDALLFEKMDPRVSLLSGDDGTAMPFMAAGGVGVISVVGNVAPGLVSAMCDAVLKGDLRLARRLNGSVARLQRLLFQVSNPIPVKAACAHLGFGTGDLRLPLVPMEKAEQEKMFAEMDAILAESSEGERMAETWPELSRLGEAELGGAP